MIARAPGKLVLSGAYAVLEGAPALVAAVDRFAVADASRPPPLLTEEVQAAITLGFLDRAPWFDASALRAEGPDGSSRKLGLGSSAAILVASLAAAWAASPPRNQPDNQPAPLDLDALLDAAVAAHRTAQAGGSGLDVAASTLGGVLLCRLDLATPAPVGPGPRLVAAPHALPAGLSMTVLASPSEARTSAMLAQVRAYARQDPVGYRALMDQAAAGAAEAVAAVSASALVAALDRQATALGELGDRAGAPIVTAAVRAVRPVAAAEGAVVLPSGAGGGDVTLLAGVATPSAALLARARAAGLSVEPMTIGARGAHLVTLE